MKKIFKFLGILVAFVMIFSVIPNMATAQLENYNSGEIAQLQAFLNHQSGISGKTNGQVLNKDYNANDPATWTGISWDDSDIKKVWAIGRFGEWTGLSLAGDLDLSDFTELYTLNIPGNQITSLDTSGDTKLIYVNCQDNHMTTVQFDYYGGYAKFTSDGNGYVGYLTDIRYVGEVRQIVIYGEPVAKPGFMFDTWQHYGEYMIDDNIVRVWSDRYTYYPEIKALFVPDGETYPSYPPTATPTPFPSPLPTPTPVPTAAPTPIPAPVYVPSYYKVVFDPNGGTRTGGGELSQQVLERNDAKVPTLEYENHNFIGWDPSPLDIKSDLTIKALWQGIYKVNFDLNGGTKTGGGDLVQTILSGDAATAPTVERYGYTFEGWNKTFDKITEDTTVYATWERVPKEAEPVKYRVIYDINGATGATPVDTNEYDDGNVALLSDNSGFTMEGFDFVGWAYEEDGDVISEEEIIVNDDVTLYAVWSELEVTEPEADPSATPVPEPVIETPVEEDSDDIPKTGDSSGVLIGVLMLIFGSGIVAFETIKRRRTRKQQE